MPSVVPRCSDGFLKNIPSVGLTENLPKKKTKKSIIDNTTYPDKYAKPRLHSGAFTAKHMIGSATKSEKAIVLICKSPVNVLLPIPSKTPQKVWNIEENITRVLAQKTYFDASR